jgi:hypothetical protein
MNNFQPPQFDRAEFENLPAGALCAECRIPLSGYYYDASGASVCERCKCNIEARFTAGSSSGRVVWALGAGLGAAFLGSLLYFLVSAITGYEFGLIAIAVGWGVGIAVRWGSNGRGGKGYQVLAVALTYLAIVSTYIPPIVQEILKPEAVEEEAAKGSPTSADGSTVAAPAAPATVRDLALGVFFLIALAAAAPFLAGAENIIGLVIIGIGLWEAWKLNRFQPLKVTGPHTIASAVQT